MEDPKNKHTGSDVESMFDEEPSQEINQGGNPARPRVGRPRKPQTQTPNQIEANFEELMKTLEEAPEPTTRTLDEIVEHNKKIITMVQDILLLDLKTISPKNVARITTPNGIQKVEIGGLHKDTRDYLLKILENCFKAVQLAEKSPEKDVGGDISTLTEAAKQLFKGKPKVADD